MQPIYLCDFNDDLSLEIFKVSSREMGYAEMGWYELKYKDDIICSGSYDSEYEIDSNESIYAIINYIVEFNGQDDLSYENRTIIIENAEVMSEYADYLLGR